MEGPTGVEAEPEWEFLKQQQQALEAGEMDATGDSNRDTIPLVWRRI
jgi:hypothetical protein